jgi:hypothetical protein
MRSTEERIVIDGSDLRIVQRVERLEREVGWWRRIGSAGAAFFVLTSLAWGSDLGNTMKEVRATSFVLVDDAGQKRGEFGFVPGGGSKVPGLVLWSKTGGIAAQIDGFPSFNLVGKDEHSRVVLSVRSDDEPTLEFLDKDGVKRVLLGRGELKTPGTGEIKQLPLSSLVLRGEDGKILWRMP